MLRRPYRIGNRVRRAGAAAGSCHGRRIQMAPTVKFLSPATRRTSPGSLVTNQLRRHWSGCGCLPRCWRWPGPAGSRRSAGGSGRPTPGRSGPRQPRHGLPSVPLSVSRRRGAHGSPRPALGSRHGGAWDGPGPGVPGQPRNLGRPGTSCRPVAARSRPPRLLLVQLTGLPAPDRSRQRC
jgi:hypothetical protein